MRRRRFEWLGLGWLVVVASGAGLVGCSSECEPWASEKGGVCFPNDVQAALACEDPDVCDEMGSRLALTTHFTLQRAVNAATHGLLTSSGFSATYDCSAGGSIAVSGNQVVLTSTSWTIEADLTFNGCQDDAFLGTSVTLVDGTAHASTYTVADSAASSWINDATYSGSPTLAYAIDDVDQLGRDLSRSSGAAACALDFSSSKDGLWSDPVLAGTVCGYSVVDAPAPTP